MVFKYERGVMGAGVTVVSGFQARATLAVGHDIVAASGPGAVLVRYDVGRLRDGKARRIVRTRDGVVEDETVELVHGCVTCLLRHDVLPTLDRFGRCRVVLVLPEMVEPSADWLRAGASYVTVVDAETFLADLDTDEDLVHRGMQAAQRDDRAVAAVVARQVEFADTVVLWGAHAADPLRRIRLRVLLHRLAPWAQHVDTAPAGVSRARFGRTATMARALEGLELGVHEPFSETGVVSVVFRARRPMHPQRLHDSLERLAGSTLRSRGHIWLATQPDLVLGWESAGGGASLSRLGRWLAALPERGRHEVSSLRWLAAQAEWDPYYGDRGNHLSFIGVDDVDPLWLHRTLAECLLSDEELALGEDGWRFLGDPFAECFPSADSHARDG